MVDDQNIDKPEWGTPEWHRQHPIFGTDFSKPPHELIEEIRQKLSKLRGQIDDIGRGYPGFNESLRNVEGLLTCGIHVLYHTMQEIEQCFKPKPICPSCNIERTIRDNKGFLRCPKCGEPSP